MRREKWASLHSFCHPLASRVWLDWSFYLLESHELVSLTASGNKGARLKVCPPMPPKAPVPGSRSSLSSVLLGSHKAYYKALKMEKFSDCFRRKQMARGEGMSQCFLA